ncbi:glucosaminidase domain-containing protein [Duganella sp. LX20W]|uniref:Glucosaminidase domain-containing protein n=1 Tax=Rugamonas brunnea TaxID=2758569 RepID=A0A7W2ICA8_9BURK|nr:glucosaminidase domain-containing protein [Rugamonas brunnea]MBA5638010.1 glucosaminidase domain-containing protein [Rugamonas brunnea]
MRQLDGMQPTTPTAATVSNMQTSRPAAALPAAFGGWSAPSGGAGFGATFRQVQDEVADFLAHGGGAAAPSARVQAPGAGLGLDPAGLALRQQAQGGAIDGATAGTTAGVDSEVQQQFLASIQPWAEETGARLGVSPTIVAAHAALESGWGRHPLRAGGADSNNLFGLKAGANWAGAVADATTTEYVHGAALKKVERFRSYPDAASAFRDYADMLTSNPRFQGALRAGDDAHAFARGLAQGGYATDPAYADKLGKLAARLQRGALLSQSGD